MRLHLLLALLLTCTLVSCADVSASVIADTDELLSNTESAAETEFSAPEESGGTAVSDVTASEVRPIPVLDDVSVIPVESSLQNGAYKDFILRYKDKSVTFHGSAVANRDIRVLPVYLNDDDIPDVAVCLVSGSGTGVNVEEPRLFDGGTLEEIPYVTYKRIIEEHVVFSGDDSYFYVTVDKDVHKFDKAEFSKPLWTEIPYVGIFNSYSTEDGFLTCLATCSVSFMEDCGRIKVRYKYSNGQMVMDSVAFCGEE